MTSLPIVHIKEISKRFGNAVAIENLSLDIAQGEFVTFLGPSGCGKSTTLRILGGFEKPDSGSVILNGKNVTHLPPEKRQVNMVFQDYALFPHMTVGQNIGFALELKGLTKTAIKARQKEIMAFLQIESYGDRYPSQLSGGQRQRVALARALAPDPALLLLDEPLGALDAKLRGQVQRELKSIQRQTNKTFLFVTHDQEEALTMSDRIIVMNNGKVEQEGLPEELYFKPINRFVAEFIGETNLISGTTTRVNGSTIVMDWYGHKLKGHAPSGTPRKGAMITAALRLEKINFHKSKPDLPNAIHGRLINQTFLGSRMVVDILTDKNDKAKLRAFIDVDTSKSIGDSLVWAGWESSSMAILQD